MTWNPSSANPARKADRAKMAAYLVELVESAGFTATVTHEWPAAPSRETMVRIEAGDAFVGVDFGPLEATNGYIVPWNTRNGARFSSAFGVAVGAQVNRFHGHKCMGAYVPDFGLTCTYVNRALRCIRDGKAFEQGDAA